MKQNKRKAFTLTELLVVVIVLAVLAAVAMPKFRRTLETRRTTEAENMLSAIRTEQEKRCIMGYDYQTDATKLGALAKAGSSKHYDYSLQSTGATATTEGYNLQIPSYKDGRICCSGEGCEALNKNYPSCESLTLPADECAAPVSTPAEPEPETPDDPDEPEPEPGTPDEPECIEEDHSQTFQIGSSGNYGSCTHYSVYNKCIKRDEEGNIMTIPYSGGVVDYSWEEIRVEDVCTCENEGYAYSKEKDNCVCANTLEPLPEETACCVARGQRTGKIVGWRTVNAITCERDIECEIYAWIKTGETEECPASYYEQAHKEDSYYWQSEEKCSPGDIVYANKYGTIYNVYQCGKETISWGQATIGACQ